MQIRQLVAFIALSCATACTLPHEEEWEETQKINTEAAYRAYAKKYPRFPQAKFAKAAIARMAFEEAKRKNTGSAYRAFATKHSRSYLAEVARKRAAAVDWEPVKDSTHPPALRKFIRANPKSDLAKVAKKRLALLAWERVANSDDPESFHRFIADHPSSPHVAKAKQGWDKALWEQSAQKGTVPALAHYLHEVKTRKLPGSFKQDAMQALDEAATSATPLSDAQVATLTARIRSHLAPIKLEDAWQEFHRPPQPLKRGQAMGLKGHSGAGRGGYKSTLRFGGVEIRRRVTSRPDGKNTIIFRAVPRLRVNVHHVQGKLSNMQMMGMAKFTNRTQHALQLSEHPATTSKSPIGFSRVLLLWNKRSSDYYFYNGKWYSDNAL